MLYMPELPEVETVRRGLEPILVGQTIGEVKHSLAPLRYPLPSNFSALLRGKKIQAMRRRAKYLLMDLEGELVVLCHLGMSGSFRIEAESHENAPGRYFYGRSKSAEHDHISFTLGNGARVIYNDPRRFGFMDVLARSEINESRFLKGLGIEPLGNELIPELLAPLFARSRVNLKGFLLDQSKIAGLGNIYVCEVLHRTGLSPDRLAHTLVTSGGGPRKKLGELCTEIRQVLNDAIAAGGSSLRDHQRVDGDLGYFQHTFQVYSREGESCQTQNCKGTIERRIHAGRSTFFCRSCQK
jgi:formamidopyrimidine-DNA glycosylase